MQFVAAVNLAPKRLPWMPEVSEPKHRTPERNMSPLGFRIPGAFPPAAASQALAYHDRPSAHPSCGPFLSTKSEAVDMPEPLDVHPNSDLTNENEQQSSSRIKGVTLQNNFQPGRTSTASNSETYRHLTGTPPYSHTPGTLLGPPTEGSVLRRSVELIARSRLHRRSPTNRGKLWGNQEAPPALLALRSGAPPRP